MFKSVFAKYITAFMLIIFISFAILTAITTVMVNDYSTDAKAEIMSGSVKSSVDYIESKLNTDKTLNFQKFINENKSDIEIMLSAIATNAEDITVVVTDNVGNIILSTGASADLIPEGAVIPKSLMDEINNGKKISGFENIEGVFNKPQLLNAAPIINESNYVFGTVFSFSDSAAVNGLLDVMKIGRAHV